VSANLITGWGALFVDALIVWTVWLLIRAPAVPGAELRR